MRRVLLTAAVALAAACSSSNSNPYAPGTETFVSSAPGGASGTATGAGGPAAPPVATPAAGPAGPDGASDPGATRSVEEADVYARVGTTLYVLNAYRGLQIVDLADLAAPRLVGAERLDGTPVDLYVRDGVAFVLTRDHVEYAVDASTGEPRAWIGSMFWAVDVSDPARPIVVAKTPIEGALEATRLVGDVLYVVSTRHPYWYGVPVPVGAGVVGAVADPAQDSVAVASIDVSVAREPRVEQTLTFPATGWEVHAHVTPERITLSFAGWEGGAYATVFRAVDISDPRGAMALGAEARVPGFARDRWGLDFDGATGLFRAVVANGWNNGAALHVFRWPTVDQVEHSASLSLDVAERLTAARFDGARVYAVTAIVRDPLWVIDTTDPQAPVLSGHLEMPGQLDYVEPRGDRLIALGHTNEAGSPWQLHVSLIDVADPARPALLRREVFGPDSGWVPASTDDVRKVFLVLDDQGLVIVPFQGWDGAAYSWVGRTQLLTFGHDSLALQGSIAHAGDLRRAFPVGAGKLAALSDAELQTIDATDVAHPSELARIDLARPALGVAVANGVAVVAAGDGWRSGVELAVTPATDPNAPTPLARVALDAKTAQLFPGGDVVWALASDWQQGGVLQAIDVSNPAEPRARGRVTVPAAAGDRGWWWGGLPDAVRAGRFLAVHQRVSWCGGSCDAAVLLFDLADADAPRLAATVHLPGASWLGGLVAAGNSVWAVHYAWVDDGTWSHVRYYADRIDLSKATPYLAATVNVPGLLLAATDDGHLYTWEPAWADMPVQATAATGASPLPWQPTTWLHALTVTDHGTARLDASVQLDGYASAFVADGGFAYGSVTRYADSGYRTELVSARLAPLAVASRQAVAPGWANLVAATSGKVFVQTGWPAQELLVYAASPTGALFQGAFPAPGWPSDVAVSGDQAFVASGPYGVTVIPLNGVSSTP